MFMTSLFCQRKSGKGGSFRVEVDSDLFHVPPTIYIPDPTTRVQTAPVGSRPCTEESLFAGMFQHNSEPTNQTSTELD